MLNLSFELRTLILYLNFEFNSDTFDFLDFNFELKLGI